MGLTVEPEKKDVINLSSGSIGLQFKEWINGGIESGKIKVNAKGAPVYRMKEGIFLLSPRIFRMAANDIDSKWTQIQRKVLKMRIHAPTHNGSFIKYNIAGENKYVTGILINDLTFFVSHKLWNSDVIEACVVRHKNPEKPAKKVSAKKNPKTKKTKHICVSGADRKVSEGNNLQDPMPDFITAPVTHIFCDGSYSHQCGRVAGFAAIVYSPGGKITEVGGSVELDQKYHKYGSEIAECEAILLGMEYAANNFARTHVMIYTDNRTAFRIVNDSADCGALIDRCELFVDIIMRIYGAREFMISKEIVVANAGKNDLFKRAHNRANKAREEKEQRQNYIISGNAVLYEKISQELIHRACFNNALDDHPLNIYALCDEWARDECWRSNSGCPIPDPEDTMIAVNNLKYAAIYSVLESGSDKSNRSARLLEQLKNLIAREKLVDPLPGSDNPANIYAENVFSLSANQMKRLIGFAGRVCLKH